MISKRVITTIITIICILLIGIVVTTGICYFGWMPHSDNGYVAFSTHKKSNDVKIDNEENVSTQKEDKIETPIKKDDIIKENTQQNNLNIAKSNNINDEKKVNNKKNINTSQKYSTNNTKTNPIIKKENKNLNINKDGSPISQNFVFSKNQDFHSYGEFVSPEEYKYRVSLINNLKIKTIVIDSISKGNGISQEYYKVVYNEKMIPAKILDELITSKEFRRLIPQKYLSVEDKISKLDTGDKLYFKNTDIKELLLLWAQGKLTPNQKAWTVNASL